MPPEPDRWHARGKYPRMDLFAPMPTSLPKSIDATQALLAGADYVAERSLATALYLSLSMQRPLFLEGEAGTGKTEIAKVLASSLGRDLILSAAFTARISTG